MGTISGLDAIDLALFVRQTPSNGPFDLQQIKANNVVGVIAVASDGRQIYSGGTYDLGNYVNAFFSDTVDQAYRNGMPLIATHVFRPELDQAGEPANDMQFKEFSYALANKRPLLSYHGIAIQLLDTGGESNAAVRRKLENFYAWILRDPNMGKVPVFFLTTREIIESNPELLTFLAAKDTSKNLILVDTYYQPDNVVLWGTLFVDIIPYMEMIVQTPGHATWSFVEWADLQGVDGVPQDRKVSVSSFRGNKEQVFDRLNFTPAVIPTTRSVLVKTNGFRARAEPNTYAEVVNTFTAGTVLVLDGPPVYFKNADGYVYEFGHIKDTNSWTAVSVTWNYLDPL